MDFLPGLKMDLTPLVSVAARGSEVVGKLLFGDLVNWQKAKDAYAAAQCEKNVQRIKDGEFEYENGKMYAALPLPEGPSLPDMLSLHTTRIEVENLLGCARVAAEQLSKLADGEIIDEPVNPDWFARWRNDAKMMGSEEMRGLWGRILKEKIQKPESISIRTLDILRNLSVNEAELFTRVAIGIVSGVILSDKKQLCTTNEAVVLLHAGLISSIEILRKEFTFSSQKSVSLKAVNCVITCHFEDNISRFQLPGYVLTQAGSELLSIPEVGDLSQDHLRLFFNILKAQTPNIVRITAHPFIDSERFEPEICLCQYPLDNIAEESDTPN